MYEVGSVWAAMWGLVGLLRGALLSNLLDDTVAGLMQEPRGAGGRGVQWSWVDTRCGAMDHKYFNLYTVTVLTQSYAETAVTRWDPGS